MQQNLTWKNATGVDTWRFAIKVDFANLKSDVDKLDIDKLKTTAVNLCKLSNAVKNDVAKNTVHDELITKVKTLHTFDNSELKILKKKYLVMISI